jgi:hypothetical protein
MTLQWTPMKQVIVVCEPALEERIVQQIDKSGGKLLTIVPTSGRGLLGEGGADVAGSLIRIECFCPEDTATRLVLALKTRFFQKYDLFLAVSDVTVLRPDKF